MVGEEGLEPSSLSAYGPEPYVFANFTTRPLLGKRLFKYVLASFTTSVISKL